MFDFIFCILDIILCLFVGLYARSLGRRGVLWFLLSAFLITPFFTGPLLFLMGRPR